MAIRQGLWSTPPEQPSHALKYWASLLAEEMLQLDVSTLDSDRFQASMAKAPLGIADLSRVDATPQTLRRTRESVVRAREHSAFLVQLRRGTMVFHQHGREALLKEGDCVLMDGGAPYQFSCPLPSSSLVLHFPRHWFDRYVVNAEDIAGTRIADEAGWGAALSATLRALDPESVGTLNLPASTVAEQVAQLLVLAADPPERGTTSHQDKQLRRVRALIRDRFDDETLDPETIAREAGFSRRYLHRLFATAGTTFCEALSEIRLERACALLADRSRSRLSITEIALRCGYADPGHFARRFRQKTGKTPTAYRLDG